MKNRVWATSAMILTLGGPATSPAWAESACSTTGFASCSERDLYRARKFEEWKAHSTPSLIYTNANGGCPRPKGGLGAVLRILLQDMKAGVGSTRSRNIAGADPSPSQESSTGLSGCSITTGVDVGQLGVTPVEALYPHCDLPRSVYSRKHSRTHWVNDLKAGIVLAARDHLQAARAHRERDLQATLGFIRENHLESISAVQSVDEARDAYLSHVEHAIKAYEHRGFKSVSPHELRKSVHHAFDSFYKTSIRKTLEAMEPARLGEFLIKRASEADQGEYADHLTPYHARMLLLGHLEAQIALRIKSGKLSALEAREKLDALAQRMDLRLSADPSQVSWEGMIPHDGYLFGASRDMANRITDSSSSPSVAGGEGIDCSLFIQRTFETLGYDDPQFSYRLTTVAMRGMSVATLHQKPLCSESNLVPGDVVLKSGHTFIFTGYEKRAEGSYTMRIIEAKGGEHRTVRETDYDPYDKPTLDCTQSAFTSDREAQYAIWNYNSSPDLEATP